MSKLTEEHRQNMREMARMLVEVAKRIGADETRPFMDQFNERFNELTDKAAKYDQLMVRDRLYWYAKDPEYPVGMPESDWEEEFTNRFGYPGDDDGHRVEMAEYQTALTLPNVWVVMDGFYPDDSAGLEVAVKRHEFGTEAEAMAFKAKLDAELAQSAVSES